MTLANEVLHALHDPRFCYAECGRTKSECHPPGMFYMKEGIPDVWVCPQCWHDGGAWEVWILDPPQERHWATSPFRATGKNAWPPAQTTS